MKEHLPGWKLKRELHRIVRQIRNIPSRTIEIAFATQFYDLTKRRHTTVTFGDIRWRKKCAIYLIYPNNGLQKSHILALDRITASGYAPVVVSNLPLSPEDRTLIAGSSHVLIERPNFGYDFGGYRDGILFLKNRIHALQRLVLLNDSVWFPMPGSYDWLSASEQSPDDFVAAIWAWGMEHQDPENYALSEWKVDKLRRHFHYASFALSISPKVLKDRGFRRFWQLLRLTDDKNATVRRGEMGLTRWIVRRGYAHSATTELTDFPSLLARLSDSELRAMFDRLISVTDPDMEKFRELFTAKLDSGKASRPELEKIVICSVARQGASYAIADFLVNDQSFPFLKKSPCTTSAKTARIMLQIAESLNGQTAAVFRDEIRDLTRKKLSALVGEG